MTIQAGALADKERWIGRGETAQILGVTEARVSQLTRDGLLSPVDTAVGRLYDKQAIEAFRDERAERGKPSEPASAEA
ncbi:MAG: DUF6397 family protein [Candidatus Omnitrophota bacterium]|nr:DUF6397 family protein [Candidatus Omnitrophota bacterium]